MLRIPQNDLINEIVQPVASFIEQFSGGNRKKVDIPRLVWRSFQNLLATTRKKLHPLFGRLTEKISDAQQQFWNQNQSPPKDYKIRIEVESFRLRSRAHGEIIPATALIALSFLGTVKIPCYVSCGLWEKLGDLKERSINLIDHLDKLLTQEKSIGLVTYQNGIMNAYESEFYDNFASVVSQFPEGTLCIGLYNRSSRFLPKDMSRFINEPTLNRESAYSFFHLLLTLSEIVPLINPHLLWTHFAHSEAGLIAQSVFSLIEQHGGYSSKLLRGARKFMKAQLVTCTYGAVHPVPDEPIFLAINTYTDKDIALTLGKRFLEQSLCETIERSFVSKKCINGKTYTVKIVESKLNAKPFLGIQLEPPTQILTIQDGLDMVWLDKLSEIMRCEENSLYTSFQTSVAVIDTINAKVFAIQDHGFYETSYQQVLVEDIKTIKKRIGSNEVSSRP